jgi:hypothetical protein
MNRWRKLFSRRAGIVMVTRPPEFADAAPGDCPLVQPEPPSGNSILACLPMEEFDQVKPHLQRISLRRGQIVRDVVERIDSLHFPIAGMIGLFAVMADGRTVVLATTGREGFPGVTAFFAGEVAPLRALVLVQGRCVCFRSQASATNTPHGPTVCRCSSPLWQ